jgi:hypothetical protein
MRRREFVPVIGARLSYARSLLWRRNRGRPIASAACPPVHAMRRILSRWEASPRSACLCYCALRL